MAGGKCKNRRNRNQGYLASSEPNSPTIASLGYTIIPDFKKDINNSLKETQNTGKQVEALKEETQKISLKEL
jgi:hypothetical protein